MAASIPEEQKVRARAHMGYLNVQESSTFVFGIPAGVQTQFAIEGAFNRLLPSALKEFVRYLNLLDAVEGQIEENMENLAVTKVGSIDLNAKEFEDVMKRYRYWQGKLSNLLGVPPNPNDARWAQWSGAAGLNIQVTHT